MLYKLTPAELRKLHSIELSYRKNIREVEDRIKKLAPKVTPPEDPKDFETWLNSGSQEWRDARDERSRLIHAAGESRSEYLRSVYEAHFAEIADDPDAIVESAFEEIDNDIAATYQSYERARTTGVNEYGEKISAFSSVEVRSTGDGLLLDSTELVRRLTSNVVFMHLRALKDDEKRSRLVKEYIIKAVDESPYTSSEIGTLGGTIEVATEKGLAAIRPTQYKRPNTKTHNYLFANELTTTNDKYFESLGLNKQKNVIVYANFVAPEIAAATLGLDDYHERLYAAIGSCLFAGNRFIPFSMIYNRGMLGLPPKERGKELTPNIERDIIDGLAVFNGRITVTNDPTGEHEGDPDFDLLKINEPLLFYQIREERVNGQVTRGIAIPPGYTPIGYRYAEMNGNEMQTDPIEAIHVDGLTYSRDNVIIANATYKRVKEIQYHNDEKRYRREIPENQRTITYAYVAQKTKKDFELMTPTERNRLKKKIDACMQSYQKSGLFDRYEHKRDTSKSFYAVVIYFEEEPKKLT